MIGKSRMLLGVACPAMLGAAVCLMAVSAAQAADTVRVGKSLGSLWAFLPVDVGKAKGIYA